MCGIAGICHINGPDGSGIYLDDQVGLGHARLSRAGLFDAGKVTKLLRKAQAVDNPSEIDSMAFVGVLSSQLIRRQFVKDFPGGTANSDSHSLIGDRRSDALRAVS